MNKITLHVENFGKIEKADIELSPFTIFMGDNNSGKSYIMTLIYGLLNLDFTFSYLINENSDNYNKAVKFAENIIYNTKNSNTYYETVIEKDNIILFENIINEFLENAKNEILIKNFNKEIDIKKLSIKLNTNNIYKFNTQIENLSLLNENIIKISMINSDILSGQIIKLNDIYIIEKFIFNLMISIIKSHFLNKADFLTKIFYLPTSRTGFMLTHPALVSNALQSTFSTTDNITKNLLTKPCLDFLVNLSTVSEENKNYKFEDITDIIENDIIKGNIYVDNKPSANISYIPKGSDSKLPMYVSSGVVTEIAPFLMFLKYYDTSVIMMEEPEMCLHPELQWKFSRCLVNLINSGVPIFITTHSDIILNHINNMIKFKDSPYKKDFAEKFGYTEKDALDKNMVSAYQFNVVDGKTIVEPLECTENGFYADTFNKALQNILDETYFLDGDN